MKKHVLIQVRSSSKRLPFKALLKVNSMPAIIFLYKRLISPSYKCTILTSNDKSDDFLCSELKRYKVNFYRGSLLDVKKRFLVFTRNFKDNDIIVRLTADNLFVDKNLVNKIISQLLKRKKEYLYTNPLSSKIPIGISAEAFKLKKLRKFKKNSHLDKEHVTINFERNKINTVEFDYIDSCWKNLNCTLDKLSDFYKIKTTLESVKQPIKKRWEFLCNKLIKFSKKKFFLDNKKIIIKSFYTKDLKKNLLIKIAKLKKHEWKYNINSQLNYLKRNLKMTDIHNLLFINNKLVGYTALKKSFFYKNNDSNNRKFSCLIFDTFIIHKKFRGYNLGEILMYFNKNKIINLGLPAFLLSKEKHKKYYLKNNWSYLSKKVAIIMNKNHSFKIFSYNLINNNMIKILNNTSKIYINF